MNLGQEPVLLLHLTVHASLEAHEDGVYASGLWCELAGPASINHQIAQKVLRQIVDDMEAGRGVLMPKDSGLS